MLKKANAILSGWAMSAVSGVFLALSLLLPRVGVVLPCDPAWITVMISGLPLLYLAVCRLVKNPGISKISSALLITIAMIAAVYIGDLFAAGEVAFIMAIGALLEDATTKRARKGLHKLIALAPTQGRRIKDGEEELIPADMIRVGDILRIIPGETVPVDGVIIAGETSIDQSVMTGESMPVDKEVGDSVFCGTINRFGAVDIRACGVGKDSSLQKLIRMVSEAEDNQAPAQRVADRWASLLVPVALLIAVITGIATGDIVRAVTVLVVFCPCALVLATPTAIMAAIGQAAKHGVIIKSGTTLEKMGHTSVIAFDKTGTLTFGKPEVCDVISFSDKLEKDDVLAFLASAESLSEHPLAKAITAYAKSRGTALLHTEGFRMESGRGISATVEGRAVLCGSERYLEEHGVMSGEAAASALSPLREQGKATVLLSVDCECAGAAALSDVLRNDAAEMITKLRSMNTRTVLLTGDNRRSADFFAKQSGVDEAFSELLPQEKVEKLVSMQTSGEVVCMIGDGVNDAPALKTADVGVAMGGIGSDISIEAADIALTVDDLSKIPYLKRLSKATVSTIKFGISLSMCINFAAVTLSVAGVLTPTTGALVHNAGSCLVVLIAALLYDRKFD